MKQGQKGRMRFIVSTIGVALLVALSAGQAAAQSAAGNSDADVRRMIESLRRPDPAAATAGRTRNLVVVPAQEAAGPAAAPPAANAATSPTTAPAPAASPPPTPAAPANPAAAAPAAAQGGASLSLAIAFEPNSSQLRPESGGTLGALVAAMLSPELRATRFAIEGHTDAIGSAAQNMRLSRERAEQVRLYLVTLGVQAERLRAVGKGATEPANVRDPRSPENRRVRVVALP